MGGIVWYENAKTIAEVIELRNKKASLEYDKLYTEKCQEIDRASKIAALTQKAVTNKKTAASNELVKATKWFNKMSISGRIDNEYPSLLRDENGIPYKNKKTDRAINGLDLIDTLLTEPWELAEDLLKKLEEFLETDLEIPLKILHSLIPHKPATEIEKPLDFMSERDEREDARKVAYDASRAVPVEKQMKIKITNELTQNIIINVSRRDNFLHINVTEAYKENLVNGIWLRKKVEKYCAFEDKEVDMDSKELPIPE